jgi:hypothetical protein
MQKLHINRIWRPVVYYREIHTSNYEAAFIHFIEVPQFKSSDQKLLPSPQLLSNCGDLVGTCMNHHP